MLLYQLVCVLLYQLVRVLLYRLFRVLLYRLVRVLLYQLVCVLLYQLVYQSTNFEKLRKDQSAYKLRDTDDVQTKKMAPG